MSDTDIKPELKIAIFGTTPTRMQGPHKDDSGWQRWTIGPGGKDSHGWERLFEVHGVWPDNFKDYLNDLSKVEPPQQIVYIPQPGTEAETFEGALERWHYQHGIPKDAIEGDWSALIRYPIENILKLFRRRMWFSSSISWCIALAMMEGATDIGLWGIDLEAGEEYVSQFAGCAHLIDMAVDHGVNIHLPKYCGLNRDPASYPTRYETDFALTAEKKAKWLEHIIQEMTANFENAQAEMHRMQGRLLTMRDFEAPEEDIKKLEQQIQIMNRQVGNLACNTNMLKGELESVNFFRRMYVWSFHEPGNAAISGLKPAQL